MSQAKNHALRPRPLMLLMLAAVACAGGTAGGESGGSDYDAAKPSAATAAPAALPAPTVVAPVEAPPACSEDGACTGSLEETRQLVTYYKTIRLTPEQEAVRVAALSALPAPCCSNFSAATCCCECNMARATWGLAKHLIAEQGYGAEQVREAVAAWHRAINPEGFSGRACFNGGCGRAFRHDGCGGMVDGELVF